MIAAQYEIPLPRDYDMDIIRRRVAERGSALDDRAGLGLKAYLIRDVADGASRNAYAPFYLWRDPAALAAFHWGGQGFSGIVTDFGRPPVRTWIGGGFTRGADFGDAPAFALRRLRALPADIDPADAAAGLDGEDAGPAPAGVHSRVWGIDPSVWQSVEFTLLSRRPEAEPGPDATLYRVLHLSAPEIEHLGASSS